MSASRKRRKVASVLGPRYTEVGEINQWSNIDLSLKCHTPSDFTLRPHPSLDPSLVLAPRPYASTLRFDLTFRLHPSASPFASSLVLDPRTRPRPLTLRFDLTLRLHPSASPFDLIPRPRPSCSTSPFDPTLRPYPSASSFDLIL